MRVLSHIMLVLVAGVLACGKGAAPSDHAAAGTAPAPSKFLFVWGGDGDKRANDWLTVLDADPASP